MKMNIIDSVKNTAFSAAVHTALEYLEKNPEENIPKAMRLMDFVRQSKKKETGIS